MEMVNHQGTQYRPEDAKRLGIKPEDQKGRRGSPNMARQSGDGDKAERPGRGRVRTKKGSSDAGDTGD